MSLSSQVAALTSPQKSKFVSLFVSNVNKIISFAGPLASAPVGAAASTVRSNPMLAPAAVATVEQIPFLPKEAKSFIQGLINQAKGSSGASTKPALPTTKTPITETPAPSTTLQGKKPIPWKLIALGGAAVGLGILVLKRKKG